MENAGSSIISALGAGSGVDFISLADELSDATYAFQCDTLNSRNETLEARISAASIIRSSLTDFASALGDRVRTGDLSPQGSVANPAVANVITAPGTTPNGSYSLEVTQLAQSQTLVTPDYSSQDDLVGEGKLNIRFGEVSGANFSEDTSQDALNITVEATDTLASLALKITSESNGELDAYVANGINGAQLVIKGQDGAQSGFVLDGQSSASSPSPTVGDLSYLSWDPTNDAGELRESSQDALFVLDTVQMSNASNTVTGLPEGMTLNLTSTNTGAPTTVSFETDLSAISEVMDDFVVSLNAVAAQLNEAAAPLGGLLGSDSGARNLRSDLRDLTTQTVMPTADEGEPSTLADLGLSLNTDGTFSLDTARLAETLATSPGGTAAMFTTGAFGVFGTMDKLARDNTLSSDPGSLGGSVSRYETLMENNDDRLERIAEQQESLRERLTSSLISAEVRVAASQSTLTFLQQQIDAFNQS